MQWRVLWAILAAIVGFGLGCGGGQRPGGSVDRLSGGGSTFVGPMMEKWASAYAKEKNIEVDYARTGSGNGIRQMTALTYQFGCTDAPLTDEQLTAARQKGGAVVHIPLCMGAVAPIYNLEGVGELRFSGPVLADIFLGKIDAWDHADLKALNPHAPLPAQKISVIRRSDPSGTTFIWTDYLAKTSDAWRDKVGPGAIEVNWPTGVGEKGSDGVSGKVSQTAGAIGYVELNYAINKKISSGSVRNRAEKFVKADMDSVTAAAEGALSEIPDNLCYTLTDRSGANAYPICGTVWAVMYVLTPDRKPAVGQALAAFFRWVVHEGQSHARAMNYAPLPKSLVERVDQKLDSIK